MGWAKKSIAYTNTKELFTERTVKALNGEVTRKSDGQLRDKQGMFIEENGLVDNLMIDGCINANSKLLVIEEAPEGEKFTFLVGFEKCLIAAKKLRES